MVEMAQRQQQQKIERHPSIPRKYVIVLVVSSVIVSFITAFVVSRVLFTYYPEVSFTSSNVKANVKKIQEIDTCDDGIMALRRFYDTWPYPHFEGENHLHLKVSSRLEQIEHLGVRNTWRNPYSPRLRVLVAPCARGNDATDIALQIKYAYESIEPRHSSQLGEVVCVDMSSESLKHASKRFKRFGVNHLVNIIELDIHDLDPSVHGVFDYILSSGVLHHLPSPEAGLGALTRMLAPDGALGIMVHASHGMNVVVDIHELLRSAAPSSLSWTQRLDTARKFARSMIHRVPESLRDNFEWHLLDDHLASDFFLVPYQGAYDVRQLGRFLASAGLCMIRPEPAWRYDISLIESLREPASRMSALSKASLADDFWASSINHRFTARVAKRESEIGEMCERNHRDPMNESLAPVWLWEGTMELLPNALRLTNVTERLDSLLEIVSPTGFGVTARISIEDSKRDLPDEIQRLIKREILALPSDAASFAENADGCSALATMLHRVPTPIDLRMYRTFEMFFGMRLSVIENNPCYPV